MSKFTKKLAKITNEYITLQIFAKNAPTAFKTFMDDVEQLAADEYGHPTVDDWCCGCSADQAFAEHKLLDQGWKPPKNWLEEQKKLQEKLKNKENK